MASRNGECLSMPGIDFSRRLAFDGSSLEGELQEGQAASLISDIESQEQRSVPGAGVRFLARQPILDCNNRVYGYELLFRTGPLNVFSGDHEYASRTMADNTILFGLEELTGGHLAFFNCTEAFLLSDLPYLLPAESTVLEVLETVEPSPKLIEACRTLKAKGY